MILLIPDEPSCLKRYGIELKEEDIVEVRAIADHEGEVKEVWETFLKKTFASDSQE